ncbi:MAG: alpha-E domain-containing protein [Candidatus Caenarcaniphilales bacterium]|nr:alpha-E domain-containing protein [Candidatus Caenarcaniphilales bacterium]
MLSRVANSIYWMSRYLERLDSISRFINVNYFLMLEKAATDEPTQWGPLIFASGDDKLFFERYKKSDEKSVIKFLSFDEENPNSIISCVKNARENARTVREIIPTEQWEVTNELYYYVKDEAKKKKHSELQDFYKAIKAYNNQIIGLIHNSLTHDQAWHFLKLAQYLERADKIARLLDVKYFSLLPNPTYVDSPYDAIEWGAVLKSVNAFQMYRQKYHRINYENVSEFLIYDRDFPRSMSFCVNEAFNSLNKIIAIIKEDEGIKSCKNSKSSSEIPAERRMKDLKYMLDSNDTKNILAIGLHEFIDDFQMKLNEVDEAIYNSFFALKEFSFT